MKDFEPPLFEHISRQNLLLDSNLLLLLMIGSYNRNLIASFKRVDSFNLWDYELLERLVTSFRDLVATPHILTEVSNLANSLPVPLKTFWFDHFALRIARIEERHIPAAELLALPEFSVFGITDAALALLAKGTLLVTADDRLCSHLQRRQLLAISFNQVRSSYLMES